MKVYLKDVKVVTDEKSLKYKVSYFDVYDNVDYAIVNLELLAFWDYVNPDENDLQGWVEPTRAVEEVQYDTVVWYFGVESMNAALAHSGFKVI